MPFSSLPLRKCRTHGCCVSISGADHSNVRSNADLYEQRGEGRPLCSIIRTCPPKVRVKILLTQLRGGRLERYLRERQAAPVTRCGYAGEEERGAECGRKVIQRVISGIPNLSSQSVISLTCQQSTPLRSTRPKHLQSCSSPSHSDTAARRERSGSHSQSCSAA